MTKREPQDRLTALGVDFPADALKDDLERLLEREIMRAAEDGSQPGDHVEATKAPGSAV